jgi:hypothetical protein
MKWPDDIGVAELALFRTFHDRRLQAAWELEEWPDTCPTEKRYYTPKWSSSPTYAATSYAARVERFDLVSGQYFQSIRAGNTNQTPTITGAENSAWWAQCRPQYSGNDWASGQTYAVGTILRNPNDGEFYQCIIAHTSGGSFDASKFGLLVPFVRRVDLEQFEDDGSALTPIGEVLRATDKDWRVTTKINDLPYDLDDQGAVFVRPQKAVTFAWVKFRTRRPQLIGDTWDSTAVYTSGRQVYFQNSLGVANFFTSNTTTVAGGSPDSDPVKWDVLKIPYIFGGYLREAGYADWLYADGQDDKALVHEKLAVGDEETPGYLMLEADKLFRQQGQNRRLNWKR